MSRFIASALLGAAIALSAVQMPAPAHASAACNNAVKNTAAYRQAAQLRSKQNQGVALSAQERNRLNALQGQISALVRQCNSSARKQRQGVDPNSR